MCSRSRLALPGSGTALPASPGISTLAIPVFLACFTCRNERARAVTTVFGGLDVGSAVGLLLCGPLIHWCVPGVSRPAAVRCAATGAIPKLA